MNPVQAFLLMPAAARTLELFELLEAMSWPVYLSGFSI
jgi:hypothetical protein